MSNTAHTLAIVFLVLTCLGLGPIGSIITLIIILFETSVFICFCQKAQKYGMQWGF